MVLGNPCVLGIVPHACQVCLKVHPTSVTSHEVDVRFQTLEVEVIVQMHGRHGVLAQGKAGFVSNDGNSESGGLLSKRYLYG